MSNPPAGWYPDPTGQPNTIRWWNGKQWTNRTEQADPADATRPADPDATGEPESTEPQAARSSQGNGSSQAGLSNAAGYEASESRVGQPERTGPRRLDPVAPQRVASTTSGSSNGQPADEQAETAGWWSQPATPQLWADTEPQRTNDPAATGGPRLSVAPVDDQPDETQPDGLTDEQAAFERARATWGAPVLAPAPPEHWTQREVTDEPVDAPQQQEQTTGWTLKLAPDPVEDDASGTTDSRSLATDHRPEPTPASPTTGAAGGGEPQSWSDVSWTAPPTAAPKPKDDADEPTQIQAVVQPAWGSRPDDDDDLQPSQPTQQTGSTDHARPTDQTRSIDQVQSAEQTELWGDQGDDEPTQIQPAWGSHSEEGPSWAEQSEPSTGWGVEVPERSADQPDNSANEQAQQAPAWEVPQNTDSNGWDPQSNGWGAADQQNATQPSDPWGHQPPNENHGTHATPEAWGIQQNASTSSGAGQPTSGEWGGDQQASGDWGGDPQNNGPWGNASPPDNGQQNSWGDAHQPADNGQQGDWDAQQSSDNGQQGAWGAQPPSENGQQGGWGAQQAPDGGQPANWGGGQAGSGDGWGDGHQDGNSPWGTAPQNSGGPQSNGAWGAGEQHANDGAPQNGWGNAQASDDQQNNWGSGQQTATQSWGEGQTQQAWGEGHTQQGHGNGHAQQPWGEGQPQQAWGEGQTQQAWGEGQTQQAWGEGEAQRLDLSSGGGGGGQRDPKTKGSGGGGLSRPKVPLIIGGAVALVMLVIAAIFLIKGSADDKQADPGKSSTPTTQPSGSQSTNQPTGQGTTKPGQSKNPKLHEGARISSDAISFPRRNPPWSDHKRLVEDLLNSSGQFVVLQKNVSGADDWKADIYVGALGTGSGFSGDAKATAAALSIQLRSSMYGTIPVTFKTIANGAVKRSDKSGWFFQQTVTAKSAAVTARVLTLTVAVFDLGDGTAVAYISDIPTNRPDLRAAESQAYKGINVG